MEIRHTEEEKGRLCIYTTILFIFVMVTTGQRFGTKVYKVKQEGSEENPKKPTKIKKTEAQGQKSNGNTELPESKR